MKLNKKTILAEMIVFKEDDDYIAKHPDWDYVVGVGDTPEEAVQIFKEMLPDALNDLKAGKWHLNSTPKPVGRPALGRETFNTKLRPEVKEFIKKTAKANKISAGELIEFMTLQFENESNQQRRKSDAFMTYQREHLQDSSTQGLWRLSRLSPYQKERLQDISTQGYIIQASDSELHITPKRPRTSSTPKPKNAKS